MPEKPTKEQRSAGQKARWARAREDGETTFLAGPPPDLERVKAAEKRYRAARAKLQAALEARDEEVLAVLEADTRRGVRALLTKTLGLDEAMIRRISERRQRRITTDVEREENR